MKKFFALLVIVFFIVGVKAQNGATTDNSLKELAKATLNAHGGDKLLKIKNMVLRGSVEVTAPGTNQPLPASFALVIAGDKYRFDIQSLAVNFLQVSDGVNTSTSMPGITLPPLNLVGLSILTKIDTEGFTVSALPEKLKKKKGFRVTSPDGYYSDFILEDKTNQVKEYESAYIFNGRTITTAVAINKYKVIDGVLVTEKYSQRLDFGQLTAYASFNAKDILLNTELTDDVFIIK